MNSDLVQLENIREEILSKMHIGVQPLNYVLVTREQMEAYATLTSLLQIALVALSVCASSAVTAFLTAWTIAAEGRLALYSLSAGLALAGVLFLVFTSWIYVHKRRSQRGLWRGVEHRGDTGQASKLKVVGTAAVKSGRVIMHGYGDKADED